MGRDAYFGEFIEEGGELPHIVGIGELADQISGPHEPWIVRRALMVVVVGDRETCALDIGGNNFWLNDTVISETLSYKALATIDVIRS